MVADEDTSGAVIIGGLLFSFFYVFISSLFEHKRFQFVHETGVAMTIGIFVGLLTFYVFPAQFNNVINLTDSIVFFVLLPLMLFSDGFNLKKRRFFQNIFYINIYGIIGTLLNFFTIIGIIYLVNYYGLIRDFGNFHSTRVLSTWEILLFAGAMCSMDDVAATSTIKPESHPKIFSVIFGEALMKDCVTIVLFKSITNLIINNNNSYVFDFIWSSPFAILGNFLLVITVSILVGIAYAIALTLLFRRCRFIMHNRGITELGLTFLCGLICYLTSELIGFSGIISMMVSGIVLSHFNNYNMSKSGLEASKLAFKTVSVIAEGMLFLLLGLASWQFETDEEDATVSWTFIFFGFISMFAGRFVNIAVTSFLFYYCVGKEKWRLNRFELEILGMSGLVKGAVPFALITTLALSDTSSHVTTYMLKSTVIFIVFITSILFNGLIPMFIKYKLKQIKEKIQEDHPSNIDTLKQSETMIFQSQLKGETEEERKYRSKTQKFWKRFEEGYIKPFLIYDYKARKDEIRVQKNLQRAQELGINIHPQQLQRESLSRPLLLNQSINPNEVIHYEELPDTASPVMSYKGD